MYIFRDIKRSHSAWWHHCHYSFGAAVLLATDWIDRYSERAAKQRFVPSKCVVVQTPLILVSYNKFVLCGEKGISLFLPYPNEVGQKLWMEAHREPALCSLLNRPTPLTQSRAFNRPTALAQDKALNGWPLLNGSSPPPLQRVPRLGRCRQFSLFPAPISRNRACRLSQLRGWPPGVCPSQAKGRGKQRGALFDIICLFFLIASNWHGGVPLWLRTKGGG